MIAVAYSITAFPAIHARCWISAFIEFMSGGSESSTIVHETVEAADVPGKDGSTVCPNNVL
jgi:hypothetical protein